MSNARLHFYGKLLRMLPAGMRGKARFARLLLGKLRETTDVQVVDCFGNTLLLPNLSDPIGFHLFADGIYEPLTASFISRHLRPGSVFVDVGANIGAFSLLAGRCVGTAGRVLAIEPSPRVRSYLEHNVAANAMKNAVVKPYAACDRDNQSMAFYDAPLDHFGMGALAPQFNVHPTSVQGRKLDGILADESIDEVDLLKVDVEGFEASVFVGAEKVLAANHPPVILFEFSDWAEERAPRGTVGHAQQMLMDRGYCVRRLSEFPDGRPLTRPLVEGSDMLVGVKGHG